MTLHIQATSICTCSQPDVAHTGSGNLEISSKAEEGVNSVSDVPWTAFRKSKALWGLACVHCSFGVGPLVCLSWLPSYYSDVSCDSLARLHVCMYSSCFRIVHTVHKGEVWDHGGARLAFMPEQRSNFWQRL